MRDVAELLAAVARSVRVDGEPGRRHELDVTELRAAVAAVLREALMGALLVLVRPWVVWLRSAARFC